MSMRGWKIFSWRGVEVKLHVSLLLILAYIVLVTGVQFPNVAAEAGYTTAQLSGSPALWGIVFGVSLFASVLIHEFGHVVLAQIYGVRVRGITLMMLGGVSEMDPIPDHREFRVAVVGPLVSFALAGLLFLWQEAAPWPELKFHAYWLARVNVALGIFNLLPIFPMDGGRAMRAILTMQLGRLRATRLSVRIGSFFALALGVVALLQFNLFLMLISLFLYATAKGELLMMESRQALSGLRAGRIGTRTAAISETYSLPAAILEMENRHLSQIPVLTRDGKMAVLSLASLRGLAPEQWRELDVADVMAAQVRAVDVEDQVEEVLLDPDLRELGALPLTERGELVGLILYSEIEDALKFRLLREARERMNRAA